MEEETDFSVMLRFVGRPFNLDYLIRLSVCFLERLKESFDIFKPNSNFQVF